jgi:hypothetical protein
VKLWLGRTKPKERSMLTRRSLVASLVLFGFVAAPLTYGQDPTQTKGARGGRGGGGNGGGGPGGFGGGGPGGFGGGGPGGGGPGGGGPGGGGFGGRNNGPANDSVERLIQIEAVQDDLKVDDKTKAKIKSLGEDAVKERTKRREKVTKLAQQQAAQLAAQQNALVAEQLAEAGIVVDPRTLNNNNNNNNGGRGGRGGNNGGPGGGGQLERQMMTIAMDQLEAQVDAKMLSLLSAAQKTRLKQIKLQQEGTRAFTTPNQEVATKLGLTEEQLSEINSASREIQGTQRQAMGELFASFAPQDNNGGGNGGGGGRGGRMNMQNLDEATRAKFDTAMQTLQTQNTATTMAAIGKVLTKSQKATYEKLIGAPFDVSKLRAARPAPGGPGAPGAAPTTETAKTGTTADPKATTKTPAKAKGGVSSTRGDDDN